MTRRLPILQPTPCAPPEQHSHATYHGTVMGSRLRVATLALGIAILAGCGLLPSSQETSSAPASPTSTMPAAACPAGDSVTPPDVENLTVNGVAGPSFTTPLIVPYQGLDSSDPQRPSVLRLEITTSTSGSPVTFRSTGAQLVETLTGTTPGAAELTVFSEAGPEKCVAVAYAFSTMVGEGAVRAQGLNEEIVTFAITTVREAARDVDLEVSSAKVDAGDSFDAIVAVTDVFGNPVENASVDLLLPEKGAGTFATGANTFTVLTDTKGRASVAISTRAGRGASLSVTAKGDLAACRPLENQYACLANQPVPEFDAASGPQKVKVIITEPSTKITAPVAGTAYSTGESFDIEGKTTGVKEGTTARLLLGDAPQGASTVKADGTFAFTNVIAQGKGSGDLGYVVIVGDLKPTPVDITVKDFTIVSHKVVAAGLKFRVAIGAWKAGTIIELTRDGAPVTKIEVSEPGRDLYMVAPDAPGFYQVQVTTSRGVVYGLKVDPIL